MNIKKIFLFPLILSMFFNIPYNVDAASSSSQNLSIANNLVSQITPRKNNTEWRYKTINGVMYKRLYNLSTRKWVGDWIKV